MKQPIIRTAILLSMLLLPNQVIAQRSNIPSSITPCLPKKDKVEKMELWGVTQDKNQTYYLVKVAMPESSFFSEDSPHIVDLMTIVLEDELGCLVKFPAENAGYLSYEVFVPQSVARKLALQDLQKQVKEKGKEGIIKFWEEAPWDGAMSPWIIFPEYAWGYKQLGIPLPEPHVIVQDARKVEVPDIP